MRALTMPKELRPAVRAATKDGWTISGGGDRRYRLSKPGHRPIFINQTAGDPKVVVSLRNLLRKEGVPA